jgi:hypothetical protein
MQSAAVSRSHSLSNIAGASLPATSNDCLHEHARATVRLIERIIKNRESRRSIEQLLGRCGAVCTDLGQHIYTATIGNVHVRLFPSRLWETFGECLVDCFAVNECIQVMGWLNCGTHESQSQPDSKNAWLRLFALYIDRQRAQHDRSLRVLPYSSVSCYASQCGEYMSMATKVLSLSQPIDLDDDLLDTPTEGARALSSATYAVLIDGGHDYDQSIETCESERAINRTLYSWMDV